MNQYVTGSTIKSLREKNHLTQLQLADRIGVSDKTISKWETGKGYPDITLMEPIANTFDISLTELLSGELVTNTNISANMIRSKFYVCPICGNVIYSIGEMVVSCHGITLIPLEAEPADERHGITLQQVENEYYVQIEHDMTKKHFISFMAAVSSDQIHMVKLYPEGNATTRFPMRGVKRIYYYCNKDGLYYADVKLLRG